MKIIKTGKILLAIVFVGIFSIIAIRAVVSKTPKDININPIYEFKVEGDFAGIEELAKKFGEEAKRDKWDQDKTSIIASLPKGKVEDNSYDVFRSVNIFQFRTKQRAH